MGIMAVTTPGLKVLRLNSNKLVAEDEHVHPTKITPQQDNSVIITIQEKS